MLMLKTIILVIDDDPKVKASLELAFPQYDFLSARCSEDGLKILEKPNEIDLVILDMKLGSGADGVDTLKKIKAAYPQKGVIMLTGYGTKETVVRALQGRADDFVDKPMDPIDMGHKMEKFFGQKRIEHRHENSGRSPIQRIIRLLEKNYEKNLTLEDAASVASLSPKYVSRLFKQETHKNFSEYRIHLRIEEAKKMLKRSSLSINEIAEKIGYENAESFMKVFKKVTGCTPSQYREQKHVA
jgi:YesN/AraC family two-component response regulator